MSKYRNTIYYDFKSRFVVIFSSSYRHRLVLKILFPTILFSKSQNTILKMFISRPPENTTPPPPVNAHHKTAFQVTAMKEWKKIYNNVHLFFYKMHTGNEAVRNNLLYQNSWKMKKNVSRNFSYGECNVTWECTSTKP